VVGGDESGKQILKLLRDADHVLAIDRPTTVKTRIIAHQQQVVRVDREETSGLPGNIQDELSTRVLSILDSVDVLVISDYSKGCISPGLLASILPEAKRRKKIVCLDPKIRYFSSYSPVTILTPNQAEASAVLGYPILTEEDLREAGAKILERIDCEALLITRGEKGMALFHQGMLKLVPARAREVFDVTGAGDTVISVLALALGAGIDFRDAVELTNIAAGIVVGKFGTATVTPDELLKGSTG
jgi:D-glycero-beta-D-manno-heptose-7-phosphate kinase